MSEGTRGRELRPRVTRRPSPGLAARMKMLEADAEKRNSNLGGNAAATAKLEIARSGTRTREPSVSSRSDISAHSDISAVSTAEEEIQIVVEAEDSKLVTEPEVEIQIEDVSDVEEISGVDGWESSSITVDCGNNNDTQLQGSNIPHLSMTNGDAGDENLVATPAVMTTTTTQETARLDKDLPPLPVDDEKLEENDDIIEPLSDKKSDENIKDIEDTLETQDTQPPVFTLPTPATMIHSRPSTANSAEQHHRPQTASSSMTNDNESTSYMQDGTAPTSPGEINNPVQSHFLLQRRASVFSLSRISFSAQLSRLTSLTLPLSSEFSDRIKGMKTSSEVSDAITSSAKQILRWIETAKTVLKGLDAEDDVEWAAQGKESLSEVDSAVNKFSGLMQVYVSAIEELQSRSDAHDIGTKIVDIVATMEIILDGWNEVQSLLKGVKTQVETAMEWTELWTTILQDIQAELEACQTIVFEMEEKRHRSMMEDKGPNGMDIDALATIVEEPQPSNGNTNEDSALLGLVARMQPLRASLDFLPMRLASFKSRAEEIFPSACEDLESRRNSLEKKWRKLESDAEEMKRELGEDKWVAIFRNAGRQAIKMMESVERTLGKLREAMSEYDQGGVLQSDLNKKVENYEAKKVHYGPAVLRVLAIIDKGVHERLTVNGEILRLHAAMQQRWKNIESEIAHTDERMTELNLHPSPQLRDSFSTIASDTRSPVSGVHSSASSPASSIVLSPPAITPVDTKAQRHSGSSTGFYKASPASRAVNTPPSSTAGSISRPRVNTTRSNASLGSNLFSPTSSRGTSPSPGLVRQSLYYTPSPPSTRRPSVTSTKSSSGSKPLDNRPKWNSSVNTNDLDTGHNFKPLTLTTPSPHRKMPITPIRGSFSLAGGKTSRIPVPSPLSHGSSIPGLPSPISPPANPLLRSNMSSYTAAGVNTCSRSTMFKQPTVTPSPARFDSLNLPPRPGLRRQHSMSKMSSSYRQPTIDSRNGDEESSTTTSKAPSRILRPASAMASGKRLSLLPRAKSPLAMRSDNDNIFAIKGQSNGSATSSRAAKRNSMPPSTSPNPLEMKPRWRH